MKCPGCFSPLSDLRDVCPKCKKDLREYKKTVGLSVTYPQLTYRALLDKYGIAPHLEGNQKNPTFLGSLSSFFGDLLVTHQTDIETSDILNEISDDLDTISDAPSTKSRTFENLSPTLQLFRKARNELNSQTTTQEIDLTSARTFSGEAGQRILLLFKQSREELQGVKKLAVAPILSSERVIESDVLNSRLEEVETDLSKATATPRRLKDLAAAKRTQENYLSKSKRDPLREDLAPAGMLRRMTAYFIDVGIALFLCAAGLIGYDMWNKLGLFDALISQSYEMVELKLIAYALIIAAPSSLYLYFFFSYFFFRGTTGESLASINIRKANGKRCSTFRLLGRALIIPLNAALLPLVTLLFGLRSITDLIVGTRPYYLQEN